MAEPVTKEALQAFVRSLCTRPAADIEKVLLHILDTSRTRWNAKSSEFLRQLKDKDMDAEALQEIEKQYKHSFDQAHRVSRMRYGVAKPKRLIGGITK